MPFWSASCGGQIADDVPDAIAMLDPFHFVPRVPVEQLSIGPLLVLTAVAAALWLLAFAGFRRRDIPVV